MKERLEMQEEINGTLFEIQDKFNDCKKTHDEEVKILHDKVC